MFETINRKPKIVDYDSIIMGLSWRTTRGDIELKDVYFRYPYKDRYTDFC